MNEIELSQFCVKTWGSRPGNVEMPGGAGRKTVIVTYGDDAFVVSKRKSEGRAQLEAAALAVLAPTGLAPKLVHRDGDWIVQEKVDGERLTYLLEIGTQDERERLLTNAAIGLITLQETGTRLGLPRIAPKIGARDRWAEDFADTPLRLAERLGLPIADYSAGTVVPFLKCDEPVFVKWDARPGNALVRPDGGIIWFDWEHCGCRAPEDDLVWLFADEWSPICAPAVKAALTHLAATSGVSLRDLTERFWHKAVMHSIYRLMLIVDRKGDGGWWSAARAMDKDRVGVTLAHVRRVCRRAADLAEKADQLQPLIPFFADVENHFETL